MGYSSSVGLCIVVSFIVIIITHWVYNWRNPRCENGKLPPGSMGIPLIGESLQFFKPSNSLDILPFFKLRMQRYGPMFRTNLAGRPVVVSTDPEVNQYLFHQEGKSVEMWYMDSFGKLFKQDGSANATGYIHKYLRNLIMNHFGTENLKKNLLSKVEAMTRGSLHAWSTQDSVEVQHSISLMIFDIITMKLFSYDQKNSSYKMSETFIDFSDGLMSFPLNIPGTAFHKCVQNQEKTLKIMKEVIKERLASPMMKRSCSDDLLSSLMEDMGDKEFVTEDFVVYIMFGLLFASFESIATTLTLAIKFLSEHPLVLHELQEEHASIIKGRQTPESSLTWAEYRSMLFTQQVINETLRMANVGPGIFRRALKDVNINGYTIPSGWSILIVPSATHMDPNIYSNPLTFNPNRWKDGDGSKVTTKNFTPFGGGIRSCAGAEFSRMLMATFLHVLVTNYKWNKVNEGNIIRNPILRLGHGFHVTMSKI